MPEPLQFRKAEPIQSAPPALCCAACKSPVEGAYFQAAGHVVCPSCAVRIRSMHQAPPAASLAHAALYGAGAAIAGCAIYAAVAIVLRAEAGLVSILVGYMVGKAIRRASGGQGGRSRQLLAVALTYFAIGASYAAVVIYNTGGFAQPAMLLVLAVAGPLLALSQGVGGLISAAIVGFGLFQAWRMTGRTAILVTGPYESSAGQA